MKITLTLIIIPILLLAGAVALQIFLSRGESRWPGLVLPGITLLFSLIAVLGVAAYDSAAKTIATVLLVFFNSNIPTILLLAIYFTCRTRRKRRHQEEIERMRIQDLD